MTENRVPNLDEMTEEELWAFWRRYTRPTEQDAEELIGDRREGYIDQASSLAAYALLQATKKWFQRGVEFYTPRCEALYGKLPEDLRWRSSN